MASLAQAERKELADLMSEVGPDAPTLCEGWTARDLAAHLVLRERRPDAAVGLVVGPLAGRTRRVQQRYEKRPFDTLVEMVRSGPPAFSFFAIPGADSAANTLEMFVHHEDLRRAQPGWAPRELPEASQELIWKRLKGLARMSMRKAPCGVVLERPTGESQTVKAGTPAVTVKGEPSELLLFAFGRQPQARVELSGDEHAVERLRGASFGV
jgi:uncharacterized protein (TIGR03085 family)